MRMLLHSGSPQMFPLSRRRFLQGLAGSVGLYALSRSALAQAPRALPVFEEIPPSVSGIHWTHNAARSPQKYLPEATGPGCAFLDYDQDGWLDIYLVNSGKCDFFTPAQPLRNALYRNNRDGTFTDVTEKARVSAGGFGMGVAAGDYDNDGFPDLYVTQYGRSILYHNNGDGTFSDVTEKAGVGVQGWASHAVWFDYDNDGRLDLFIAQFAAFDKTHGCGISADGKRHYCIPRIFPSTPSWLFRNNGDGTFTDVSKESGIAASLGKAWGAVATDVNNDGRMDLFVANDSNIDEEIFSLYRNNHDGTFDDQAMRLGVGMATRWMSGWGMKFIDYDNDGNLDLFLVNGFPDDLVEDFSSRVKYHEPLLLFQNMGGKYKNVSEQSGPVFSKSFSARGMAVGDFNNDGGIDVLVAVNDGAPILLRNNVGKENHWLGVQLVGTKSNRDAVGARLIYQAGDLTRSRMKVGGGSFLSSHYPRMLLGLGKHPKLDWLDVHWPQPSGAVERIIDLPVDRYITITEGTGKWK